MQGLDAQQAGRTRRVDATGSLVMSMPKNCAASAPIARQLVAPLALWNSRHDEHCLLMATCWWPAKIHDGCMQSLTK